MESLNWIDILGPVLTTLAALIALAGDPYNRNGKWYTRLNLRGKIIASLIVLSVIISLVNTSITNKSNKSKLDIERDRFDDLKLSYDSIKFRFDSSKQSVDSLNRIIDKLNENLVLVQNNEIKEQRRLYDERKQIVFQNLYNEIVRNYLTADDWDASELVQHFDDNIFPGSQYSNKYLIEALNLPLDNESRVYISVLIKQIDNLNYGILQIRSSEKGSNAKMDNIKTFSKIQNEMISNLDHFFLKVKGILPDYKVRIEIRGNKKKIW